ncbi:MAG: dTDP-4-dehydrorhamnose reductase, partial [Muribaculaceae bacterium]|nr:dTDP-4-dehydrorhamnose reductase [Muribaculaceae bacterium]
MTLLITGANGQLGRELRTLLDGDSRFDSTYTDVEELDITSPEAVDNMVNRLTPDYIINCAAYTAVDRAEDDEATALLINARAVEILATAAARVGAKMIHVSTDYVFDGNGNRPYHEDDMPHPVSAYGRTKLAGEQVLQRILPEQSVILRTAWLYSPHGKNFVKTMLELGRPRDHLRVVYDQVGSPTLAADLARAIITVMTAIEWHPGVYHYTNEGAISWYDFTKAIHRLAGITTCDVQPCL